MPLIDVSIAEGRTPQQLRALVSALHRAAEESVGALPENTTVIIREVPATHWSKADQTIAERTAAQATELTRGPSIQTAAE
ncbi:4-oxalocrotonate tautomerase family protein [Arthrobacter sp. I2-34]|uniref:4-oxalocrotonate tautomerase family protein n=1 Tax=Arthrobacter hankyongi TaxID=2904801 RepID=A0ABS9LB29_9MICC|nr:tautomerase family protein [Arthrobacter hankyongi]MCG2623884.1 4-oxalocrotonate tautomerase family protein [Arthrobacter hankyongi]